MSTLPKPPSVTAVLHSETGVITAFFNELPGLLVQGKSNEDVKKKLMTLLTAYIRKWQAINDFEIEPQTL